MPSTINHQPSTINHQPRTKPMPQLNNHTMSGQPLPTGQYGFSATRIDHLGASEYTLVTIVTDVSPSVGSLVKEMETALREIVTACKYSPRADNLMLRLVTFDAG